MLLDARIAYGTRAASGCSDHYDLLGSRCSQQSRRGWCSLMSRRQAAQGHEMSARRSRYVTFCRVIRHQHPCHTPPATTRIATPCCHVQVTLSLQMQQVPTGDVQKAAGRALGLRVLGRQHCVAPAASSEANGKHLRASNPHLSPRPAHALTSLTPPQDRATSVATAIDGTNPLAHIPGATAAAIAAIADVSGGRSGQLREVRDARSGVSRHACPASQTSVVTHRLLFHRRYAMKSSRLHRSRLIPPRLALCRRSGSRREAAADRRADVQRV